MAVKQEVVLEFNADTSDVQKSLSGLDKDFDKVGKSANDAAEEVEGLAEATDNAAKGTKDLGENSKKAGSDMKTAGKTGATGFKLVGTALQATGLFTLVTKVLAPIIQAFTDNKKVAEALEVAFAALGTVINVIVDAASPLGDLLIDIFTNPQQVIEDLKEKLTDLFGSPKEALLNFANLLKENIINRFEGLLELLPQLAQAISLVFELKFAEAAKTAADAVGKVTLGVENVTDKVVEAASAAADFAAPFVNSAKEAIDASTLLTQKQQALRDAQRELNVATAEGAAEVEELKRQSDDQRLSTEERIEAATRAAEINQRFADENVAISQQRAQLLREEIALQGETAERLDELASAEIEAANAAQASSTIQTELQNKLFALNQEAIAQEEEKIALEEEGRLALEETLAEEARLKDEAAKEDDDRREKQREKDLANAELLQQAKFDIAKSTLGALSALQQAFASEDQARAEKNFKIQKALSLAQATIAGVEGVQNAFTTAQKSPITALFPAYPFIQAGLAGAFSVAQIATIAKSSFSSPAPPPPDTSGGGGGVGASAATAATAPAAPQLDLAFLGGGAEQTGPIQAFVLSENVSNAQQANQLIEDQATL